METTTTERNHAVDNACGHAETIAAMHEAWQFCSDEAEEGRYLSREAKAVLHEHGYDGDRETVREAIETAASEQPLAVDVRCEAWQTPGTELQPDAFQILLSTGGPALRIVGSLSDDGEPQRPRMEWQDWGTPWTEHRGADADALAWFAGLFVYV